MADVAGFFHHLDRYGDLPTKINGTLRFDLTSADGQVDHWLMVVKKGNVFVAQEKQDADVVITTDRDLFVEITSGRANLVAALLRNQISVEGNLPLLLAFRRALPSVPGARDPRQAAAAAGERR